MSVEVARLAVALEGKDAGLNKTLDQADRNVRKFGDSTEGAGKKSKGFFDGFFGGAAKFGLAATGIGIGFNLIGGAVGAVLKPAADFDQAMAQIRATAGASDAELAGLKKTALDLGMATDVGSVSATDAAHAIFELGKAGVPIKDIMNGAAKATLQLAAAGGPEYGVAKSAALAANALNTFRKEGLSTVQVANTLVGAANASSIGLEDLQYAMAASGTVAVGLGMSFSDLATNIAVFGMNGLKGSDAGTSLKTMLINLQPHTKAAISAFKQFGLITADGTNILFDHNGKVKESAELAGILQDKLGKLAPVQLESALKTMFGTDAMRAANIMVTEGKQGYEDMAAAMLKQGDAAKVAGDMSNNLAGKWEAFLGTMQTLAIKGADFLLPFVSGLTDTANAWAGSALDYLSRPEVQANIGKVVDVVGKGFSGAWDLLSRVGRTAWNDFLEPALTYLTSPDVLSTIGSVASAIGSGLAGAWDALRKAGSWAFDNVIKPVFDYFSRKDVQTNIGNAASAIGDFVSKGWSKLSQASTWVWDNAVKPFFDYVTRKDVQSFVGSVGSAIGDFASKGWDVLMRVGSGVWDNAIKPFFEWVSSPEVSSTIGKIAHAIGDVLGGAFKIIAPLLPAIILWFGAWKLAQFATDAAAAGVALLTKLVPGMAAANAEAAKGAGAGTAPSGAGGGFLGNVLKAVPYVAAVAGVLSLGGDDREKPASELRDKLQQQLTEAFKNNPLSLNAAVDVLLPMKFQDTNGNWYDSPDYVQHLRPELQDLLNNQSGLSNEALQAKWSAEVQLEFKGKTGSFWDEKKQEFIDLGNQIINQAQGHYDRSPLQVQMQVNGHFIQTDASKQSLDALAQQYQNDFVTRAGVGVNVVMNAMPEVSQDTKLRLSTLIGESLMGTKVDWSKEIATTINANPNLSEATKQQLIGLGDLLSGTVKTEGEKPISVSPVITVTPQITFATSSEMGNAQETLKHSAFGGNLATGSSSIFGGIAEAANNAVESVKSTFSGSGVSDSVTSMGNAATAALHGAWGIHSPSTVFLAAGMMAMAGLSGGIQSGGGLAIAAIAIITAAIVASMRKGFANTVLASIALAGMLGFSGGIHAGGGTAVASAAGVTAQVRGAVAGGMAAGNFVAAGRNVGAGLAIGIQSSASLAIAQAHYTAIAVKNTVNATLGIKSPSTEMMTVGRQVNAGLAEGLMANGAPLKAAKDTATQVMTSIAGGITANKAKPGTAIEGALNETIALAKRVVTKGTKDLMDAFSSITGATGGMFDLMSKLGGKDVALPGAKLLNAFLTGMQSFVIGISDTIHVLKPDLTKANGEMAGFMGQMAQGIGQVVDVFTKLGATDFVMPAQKVLSRFLSGVEGLLIGISDELSVMAPDLTENNAALADIGGRMVVGLLAAVEPLDKMGKMDFMAPTHLVLDVFFDSLDYFAEHTKDRISEWMLRWSDAAAKVAKAVGDSVVGLFQAVAPISEMGKTDFYAPPTYVLDRFFGALDYFAEQTKDRISEWWLRWSPAAATVADSVGKSVISLLSALDPLSKAAVGDWFIPTREFLDRYFGGLNDFAEGAKDYISEWQLRWAPVSATVAKALSDSVISLVAALDPLSKLARADLIMPTQHTLDVVFGALDMFAQSAQDRISEWWNRWNNTVYPTVSKALADSIGSLVGALTPLSTLAKTDFKGITVGAVQGLMEALNTFAKTAQDYVSDWWARWGATTIPDITKNIAASVGSLLGTLDPLLKLAALTADKFPAHEIIMGFFGVLDDFLSEFESYAADWLSKAPAVLADLAGKVGDIGAGIGKVFDPILKTVDVQKVTRDQIEGAFSNLWFMLHELGEVMKSGELQGDFMARAQAFGTAVGTIFDGLGKALGVATGTGSGLSQFLSDLQGFWLTVFGPATQEKTLLWYIFGKPNGLFNWMDTNVPIYMAFSAGVWKTALDSLQETIGTRLAEMRTAVYNDALLVGQAIQQGIADGAGGNGGGGGSDNPPPPPPRVPFAPFLPDSTGEGNGKITHNYNPIFIDGIQVTDADLHKLLSDVYTQNGRSRL